MKRQNFLRVGVIGVAVASLMSLAACGSSSDDASASDTKKMSLTVAVSPTLNGLDAHLALEKGYFEKEGLAVTLVPAGSPAETLPQLLGGKIDIGLMDMVSPTLAVAKGVPLKAIAPGAVGEVWPKGAVGVGNIFVKAGSSIASLKDLTGKTVCIPQINSQVWLDIRQSVDEAGGDSTKIKFVEAPDQLGTLKAGHVDACSVSEPKGTAALADTTVQRLDHYTTAGGGLAYVWTVTDKFGASHTAAIEAFTRAILEANKAANADPALRSEVAASYIEAPAALLAKAVYPKFGETALDASQLQAAIDRIDKYGMIGEGSAPQASDMLLK